MAQFIPPPGGKRRLPVLPAEFVDRGVQARDGLGPAIFALQGAVDITFKSLIFEGGANAIVGVDAGRLTVEGSTFAGSTDAAIRLSGDSSGALLLDNSISNPGALGSGTVYVQNGPVTLQLVGGITVTNTLRVANKPSGTGIWPCVENLSGNNTLRGPLELNQNGSIGWLIYATSGHLVLSGANTPLDSTQTSQNTTRTLWLRGDAVGEWNGSINDNAAANAKITLRKDGLGTWTLGGANAYTAPTTASVRKAARELQEEEREHVELVRAWMKKVPKPDADWADDPDPPRYTD